MAFSCLRKLSTMYGKSLKVFPDVPETIEVLLLHNTGIEEVPSSIQNLSRLTKLSMHQCENLKILPSNINLVSLRSLDLSFCTQLKIFPEISTSIVYLNLRNTAIEEVPSSIWNWLSLTELNLQDCKSLFLIGGVKEPDSLGGVSENTETDSLDVVSENTKTNSLDGVLENTETDSLDGVSETSQELPLNININGCINLLSLPHIPDFVKFVDADGSSTNPETCLNFGTCFNLSQETKTVISNCKLALLPGKELPSDFDHRAKGGFLTINLGERPLNLFLRVKACILLIHGQFSENEDDTEAKVDYRTDDMKLSCCIWGVHNGGGIGSVSCKYHLPALLGLEKRLCIFESSICIAETDLNFNKINFEFKIIDQYWRIEECGVQLLDDDDYGSIYNEAEYEESAEIMITALDKQTEAVRERNNFKGKPCVSDKPLQVYVRKKKRMREVEVEDKAELDQNGKGKKTKIEESDQRG